ncbi:hypothetical protein HW555_009306, partial [Spodoptera exigua]
DGVGTGPNSAEQRGRLLSNDGLEAINVCVCEHARSTAEKKKKRYTNSTICSMSSSFGYCEVIFDRNLTGTQNMNSTESTLSVRYAFSNSSNRCFPFLYSGCGGNDNNFKSYEECRKTCGGRSLGR